MKTKITVILIIAIAFIVGCQKEEVKPSAGGVAALAGFDAQPAAIPPCGWYATGNMVQVWRGHGENPGMSYEPEHAYAGPCAAGAGSIAGRAVFPTQQSDDEEVADYLALNIDHSHDTVVQASGIRYDFKQGGVIIYTLYTDSNGELGLSNVADLASGTYTVYVSKSGYTSKTLNSVVLPLVNGNDSPLYAVLDEQ